MALKTRGGGSGPGVQVWGHRDGTLPERQQLAQGPIEFHLLWAYFPVTEVSMGIEC